MNLFKISFFLLTLLICILLIIYAVNIYPIPGVDSIVFIPTAILYSQGYGFINPWYYVTYYTDPTYSGLFNYYVPFFPMALGILSKMKPDIKTIFFICSIFSITNLLLFYYKIQSITKNVNSKILKIILLLSIPYLTTYFLPTVGRPETFTTLFSFIIYLLYSKRDNINIFVYNAVVCLLFSFLLSSQIMSFFFSFSIYITYELLNTKKLPKCIWVNGVRLIAILGLTCFIISCSPIGLSGTITGIKLHIAYINTRHDNSTNLLLYYWTIAPLNVGFLFIFLMCIFFYIKELQQKLKEINLVRKVLIIFLQIILIYGIIKFILYAAPTIYNATQFILPISCYIIYNLINFNITSFKNVFNTFILISYISGTFLMIRGFILFIDNIHEGKSFENAKNIVRNITSNESNVYFSQNLWYLNDSLKRNKLVYLDKLKKDDLLIYSEVYREIPTEFFQKCDIFYDWRTKGKKDFLGIPIRKHPQGFSFVVFKVKDKW